MAKKRIKKYQEGNRVRRSQPTSTPVRSRRSEKQVSPKPTPTPRPPQFGSTEDVTPIKPIDELVEVKPPTKPPIDDDITGGNLYRDYWFTYMEEFQFGGWRPILYCMAFQDRCPNFSPNLTDDEVMAARNWWRQNEPNIQTGPPEPSNMSPTRTTEYEFPGEHLACPDHPSYLNMGVDDVVNLPNTYVGEMPSGCWRKTYDASEGVGMDVGCCDDALTTIQDAFGMSSQAILEGGFAQCDKLEEFGYMCGGCNCHYDRNSLYNDASLISNLSGNSLQQDSYDPFTNTSGVFYAYGPSCPQYHCVGGTNHNKLCDIEGGVTNQQCLDGGGYGCGVGSGCSWGHKILDNGTAQWNPHDASCCEGCLDPLPYLTDAGNDSGCEGPADTVLQDDTDWTNRFNFSESGGVTWNQPPSSWLEYCLGICGEYGKLEFINTNIPSLGNLNCEALTEAECGYFETGVEYDSSSPICLPPSNAQGFPISGGCCGWNEQLGQCVFKGGHRYFECSSRCINDNLANFDMCIDNCQPAGGLGYCLDDSDGDGICDEADTIFHPEFGDPDGDGVTHPECVGIPPDGEQYTDDCVYNCYGCDNVCCNPGVDCAVVGGCDNTCGSTLVLDDNLRFDSNTYNLKITTSSLID